jgi:hypothetical protein
LRAKKKNNPASKITHRFFETVKSGVLWQRAEADTPFQASHQSRKPSAGINNIHLKRVFLLILNGLNFNIRI